MSTIVLLGPQRLDPNVGEAVADHPVDGPLAAITAGWEEREPEDGELAEHLGRPLVNLELFRRTEELLLGDRELLAGYRWRQERMHTLQNLYRLRLGHALEAARTLFARDDDAALLEPEFESALEAVRVLDAHHLERVRAMRDEFNEAYRPRERDAWARHRDEVCKLLRDCRGVLIAGGHVGVLLHRIRLFGLEDELAKRTVFAWAGGAMVLCERIVLFHDSPPQGAGDAEVFEPGLGLVRGVVALPQAARRLRLEDPVRVALFARRFAPDRCIALDPLTRVDCDGDKVTAKRPTGALAPVGEVEPMEVVA